VLQEAAMVALRKLDQFRPGTSFVAWMARIIRFIGLNQARQHRRTRLLEAPDASPEPAIEGEAHRMPDPVDGHGRLTDDGDSFDDRLLAALESLDETARACLLLRTVMDLPYAQIARALDIPEGTAMSHVHRARTALRSRLAKEPPAATPSRGRTSHA
jgi:RNA polymerase sigma-70 factor (ECF subfamily)